jgi:penicillin V acylase-like amidase (Ntn superfamily)
MSVHVHITDKTGAGLLIEGTANGSYALYDTQVLSNEPAWPLMTEWRDQWMAYNFSQAPGISWFPYPATGVPAVVPFNSAYDERPTGYFGSMSRYLRTWLAVQNCSAYPWPSDGVWSPGAANASVEPPPAEFKALKRAENWLGAVVVPRSQLVSNGGEFYEIYATQLSILRSYTDGVYYYKTPADNQWSSIDLGQLAQRAQQASGGAPQVLRFPLGKESSPFSIDRTLEGEPYKGVA